LGYADSQSRVALGDARAASPSIETAGLTPHETRSIDRLPLLGAAERHRGLVEWNAAEADISQDTSACTT
jgi:hypothetical protein